MHGNCSVQITAFNKPEEILTSILLFMVSWDIVGYRITRVALWSDIHYRAFTSQRISEPKLLHMFYTLHLIRNVLSTKLICIQLSNSCFILML